MLARPCSESPPVAHLIDTILVKTFTASPTKLLFTSLGVLHVWKYFNSATMNRTISLTGAVQVGCSDCERALNPFSFGSEGAWSRAHDAYSDVGSAANCQNSIVGALPSPDVAGTLGRRLGQQQHQHPVLASLDCGLFAIS